MRTPTETLIADLRHLAVGGSATQAHANALEEAADRLEELSAWRPMSSAPKNGRTVLLRCLNELGKRRVVKASWMSEDRENDDCEPGWYERSEAHEAATETVYPIEHEPTGWLPLPPPAPAQTGEST